MTQRPTLLMAALCALLGFARPVAAQTDNDTIAEAKAYFQAGVASMDKGKYRVAIAAFKESLRRVPRAQTFHNLAYAAEIAYWAEGRQEDLVDAVNALKEYRKRYPNGSRINKVLVQLAKLSPVLAALNTPTSAAAELPTQIMVNSNIKGARAQIGNKMPLPVPVTREVKPGKHQIRVFAPGYVTKTTSAIAIEHRLILASVTLEPKPAQLRVRVPRGSRVAVDGRRVDVSRKRHWLPVAPGEHTLMISKRGRKPVASKVKLRPGQSATIHVPLRVSKKRRASYWVAGGAGLFATSAAIAGIVAWRAQSRSQDLAGLIDGGGSLTVDQRDEHNRMLDRRDTARGVAYVATGLSITALVAAGYLYLFDHERASASRAPLLRLTPGPGGASGHVSWSY